LNRPAHDDADGIECSADGVRSKPVGSQPVCVIEQIHVGDLTDAASSEVRQDVPLERRLVLAHDACSIGMTAASGDGARALSVNERR
jgi:hypothetical protein